ncbi:hypothetical protein P7C73_g6289, partial [Tremellales sp. Uapishka_1]
MILHRRSNHPALVIQAFREIFLWIGLPPFPIPSPSSTQTPTTKPLIQPSIQVLTTLLPPLLTLIPTTQLNAFHANYLALQTSLPPALRAHPQTHLAFLRQITHEFGPDAGLEAVGRILQSGLDPGAQSWNSLLLSLAGRGKFTALRALLDGMDSESAVGEDAHGIRLPRPTERTYEGLIHVLEKRGMKAEANEMRARMTECLAQELGRSDGLVEGTRDRGGEEVEVGEGMKMQATG